MWPNLLAFHSKLLLVKNNGVSVGIRLQTMNDAHANRDALEASGFVRRGVSMDLVEYFLPRPNFTLKELQTWFPAFTKAMIDQVDPVVSDESEQAEMVAEPGHQPELPNLQHTDATQVRPQAESPPVAATPTASEPRKSRVRRPKITDSGEKIGGAVKDRFARRAIVPGDIAGMTKDERETHVKKARVWEYSFKKAKEAGVSCGVAEFIRTLRLNFPEMGVHEGVEAETFVNLLTLMKERLSPDNVKTGEHLVKEILSINASAERAAYLAEIKKGYFSGRGAYKQVSWTQSILNFDKSMTVFPEGESRPVTWRLRGYNEALDNPENAVLIERWWQQKLRVGAVKKERAEGEPDMPDRPHLDILESAWLPDHDITAQELMDRFGFRGVEFGEWLPQDERQRVLNEAYGACEALAFATGFPDRMMSLNGTLAAAFGSRGRGGRRSAAAHYEPSLRVFNLTRFSGAGSMAHEFGHALDHYLISVLNESLKEDYSPRKIAGSSFLSDVLKNAQFGTERSVRTREEFFEDVRAHELAVALNDVINRMEVKRNADLYLEKLTSQVNTRISYAASWFNGDGDRLFPVIARIALDRAQIELPKESWDRLLSDDPAHRPFINREDLENAAISGVGSEGVRYSRYGAIIEIAEACNEISGSHIDALSSKGRGNRNVYGNLSTLFNRLEELRLFRLTPNVLNMTDDSNYRRNALALDGKRSKPYYPSTIEMFARAFESYVYDVLKNQNLRCDYLVHSVDEERFADPKAYKGNPYPTGDERLSLAQEFEHMLSIVGDIARDRMGERGHQKTRLAAA